MILFFVHRATPGKKSFHPVRTSTSRGLLN